MKKPDLYKIPVLPSHVLQNLQRIQEECRQSLLACGIPGTSYLDHDRATETILTFGIEEFDARLDHYFGLPYCPIEWGTEILHRAILSTLSCFPNYQFRVRPERPEQQELWEDARQFFDELHDTALLHLMHRMHTGSLFKSSETPVPVLGGNLMPTERKDLLDDYRRRFPEAKIIDICWAAGQHRREWDRWMNKELPDGCKADRCFLKVLRGEKAAASVRKEVRPKGWK